MVTQFRILPEAEQDAADAYGWYEERQPGLGEEFLRCVEACMQSIRRKPEIYSLVHESYRRALVRRFPYGSSMSMPRTPSRFTPSSIARKTHESGVVGCRKERPERQLTRLSKKSAPEKRTIENKGLFWRKLAQSGVFRQSQQTRCT
jgi:plasmid stabilization system protein ParE